MGLVFLGLATKTLNTWKASNWMLLLLSRSRFIISLRFAESLMYRVMMLKLARSNKSSPNNCDKQRININNAREYRRAWHARAISRSSWQRCVL